MVTEKSKLKVTARRNIKSNEEADLEYNINKQCILKNEYKKGQAASLPAKIGDYLTTCGVSVIWNKYKGRGLPISAACRRFKQQFMDGKTLDSGVVDIISSYLKTVWELDCKYPYPDGISIQKTNYMNRFEALDTLKKINVEILVGVLKK
jgi:hypothetical protein